jgi:hypothetical protein
MSHTINDLREHLFATLEGLRNKENPLDIERARAVSEVAQTIINTAKVEVEHMKVSGEMDGTGFIASAALPAPTSPPDQAAPRAGLTVLRNDSKGITTVEQRNGMTITRNKAK